MIKIFENEQLVAEAIQTEMMAGLTHVNPVFCLAAGSTPAKGYELFSQASIDKSNLSHLKIVSLDEWVGIKRENRGSCYQMLNQDLFKKINLPEEQIVFYDGAAVDLVQECNRIDDFIKKNPITFSLMGVGMNGHIGLNEPGFPVLAKSSIVKLSETTKIVAQKYFEEETALNWGITLGLKQIIRSERVIVVITGAHKAGIVKEIFRDAGKELPAGQLLGHDHIDFYLDQAAASHLNEEELQYE